MWAKLISLIRIPELRSRILFTFGALLVFRLGSQIPLPGLDLGQLHELLSKSGAENALFGLMNIFSGGSFDNPILFSLGVMPYISASIILSVLVKIVPSLEALSKEGMAGQKKINQYTRYLTVPICLLQSLFVVFGVVLNESLRLVPVGTGLFSGKVLGMIVAMTAGTLFLMWLGEQISEFGVGNGVSIIIMAGIVDRLPQAVMQLVRTSSDATRQWQILTMMGAMWVVAVVAIVYITKGQRRIPTHHAKLTRGQRMVMGQGHYMAFKVNQAGVMPIIFASAIFIVPNLIGVALGWDWLKSLFSRGTGFIYVVSYTALIFFFSFFWNTLIYNPSEIANNLKEHGSFIPGIRPGRKTAEYLDFVITRLTLAGSACLAIIALVPNVIHEGFDLPSGITTFLGGTSILIVVGVALDLVDKLNSHLVMHNYEEFGKGGGSGWARTRS